MAGTYTRWYRVGSVTVTKNSASVVGNATYWLTAGLNPGDIFSLDGVADYEILTITDDTHITLKTPFTGNSASGSQYHIIRNFTATSSAQVAAQAALLYQDVARYWDQDTQTLHGKSAYELALQNGYAGSLTDWLNSLKGTNGTNGTNGAAGKSAYEVAVAGGYSGTQAEWLESLKAAGEWTTLDNRTNVLTMTGEGHHNSIYGGRNLGNTFTDEQLSAIALSSYTGLYVGDAWNIDSRSLYILGFNCFKQISGGRGIINKSHVVVGIVDWNNKPVMDAGFTNENGLIGTNLYTDWCQGIYDWIEGKIGAEHLTFIETQVSNHATNSKNDYYETRQEKFLIASMPMMTGVHSEYTAYPNLQFRLPYFSHLCNMRPSYGLCLDACYGGTSSKQWSYNDAMSFNSPYTTTLYGFRAMVIVLVC